MPAAGWLFPHSGGNCPNVTCFVGTSAGGCGLRLLVQLVLDAERPP